MKLAPVLFAAALIAVACAPANPDLALGGPVPTVAATFETLPVVASSHSGAAEVYARLAAERTKRLADLKAYTDAGHFPSNLYEERAVPVFLGANRVYCAVGHLMVQDGQQTLVDSIVASNNLIRLADHPQNAASDWIVGSGLTYEECALIQPSYHWRRNPGELPDEMSEPRADVVGRQLTQERLRAVLHKLNQDTPAALRVALERACKPMGGAGFAFADGKLPTLVDNPGQGPLLVRLSVPGAQPGPWRKLAHGQSCRIEGAGIVEWRPAMLGA